MATVANLDKVNDLISQGYVSVQEEYVSPKFCGAERYLKSPEGRVVVVHGDGSVTDYEPPKE